MAACENCRNRTWYLRAHKGSIVKYGVLEVAINVHGTITSVINTGENWSAAGSGSVLCSGNQHLGMALSRSSSPAATVTFEPGTANGIDFSGHWTDGNGDDSGTWSATQTSPPPNPDGNGGKGEKQSGSS